MSEYPEFVNRFSIVDVVSYFAPGALYSLYTHYLMVKSGNNVFLEAIDAIFSGSIFARAVYFCVVSYILGMMLSEVSYWIWTGIRKLFGKCTKNAKNAKNAKNTYNQERLKKMSLSERFRKAQLFQCFYGLFRSLSVVFPVLFVQSMIYGSVSSTCLPIVIVAEIICIARANRFCKKHKLYRTI